jgi:hypothetical protein
MPKAIYALYPDPDSADRAVRALRGTAAALGVKTANITIISSEPFEEFEFGRGVNKRDHTSLMPWISAFGGLVGGLAGYGLAAFTQNAYPLPTGGMPIVALWTNGIITYETTMLGVILSTLITLLITTRLPNPRKKLYDPAVSDGKILVGVVDPPDASRASLEKALRDAGTESVVSSR